MAAGALLELLGVELGRIFQLEPQPGHAAIMEGANPQLEQQQSPGPLPARRPLQEGAWLQILIQLVQEDMVQQVQTRVRGSLPGEE